MLTLSLVAALALAQTPAPVRLDRTVFGYFRHDVSGQGQIDWKAMSHVAYFSLDVIPGANGAVTLGGLTRLGPTTQYPIVKAQASANGVKLVLAFTNFTQAQIEQLCSDPYRANAIAVIVQAVKDNGAQGANIDFESVSTATRANFVTFMDGLTQAMHAQVPGSHVSIATPMKEYPTSFFKDGYDYAALAEKTDGVMPMAYNCKTTSTPGPQTPLINSSFSYWGTCSVADTIAFYKMKIPAAYWGKVMVLFPWYGNTYPTFSVAVDPIPTARDTARGLGVSAYWGLEPVSGTPPVPKPSCRGLYAANAATKQFDTNSQTPWLEYSDAAGIRQLWCDDVDSFDAKLQAVVAAGLGGVGIWAIGYNGTDMAPWQKLRDRMGHLNQAPVAAVSAPAAARVGDTVTISGSGSTDADGDALTYDWQQTLGPPLTFNATAATQTITFTAPGTYELTLVVNDSDVDSAPVTATIAVTVNQAPLADAVSQRWWKVGDTITLDGSVSSDPDGDPLTYAWAQLQGPAVSFNATAASTTFPATKPGFYRFSLTVTDDRGLSSSAAEVSFVVWPKAVGCSGTAELSGFAPLAALALLAARRRRR